MDLIPWRNKRQQASTAEHPADRALERVQEGMSSLFENFLRDPFGAGLLDRTGRGAFPELDITESDDDVCVRVEVPGMDPKDLRIDVTGNTLTISGEKSDEREEKKRDYRYSERRWGSFSRTVQLPAVVNADQVDATHKDGVLTITLPKREETKPRRIAVKGG